MPNPRVSFQFTDEQWKAIRSVRKSWPDDIDWVQVRGTMEQLGRMYLMVRAQRSHLGSPVKIRNRLRTALRLIRKLQAAMNALPDPLRGSSPDSNLEEQDRRLQSWLVRYEYLAGPQFRGRKDPYRHWLELGLLTLWIDLFKGDTSFSRKLDGTPYGPLVEFLTLTLHAITGSAPGPDCYCQNHREVQKTKAVLPVLNLGARLIFQLPRVHPVLQSVPNSHMEPEDKAWRAPKLPVASRSSQRSRSRRRL